MKKVVVTLSETPAGCSLEIDGKKITNAVRIEASVDIDTGPEVSYNVPNLVTGGEDTIKVNFDAVIDNTPVEEVMQKVKDGKFIVDGGNHGL